MEIQTGMYRMKKKRQKAAVQNDEKQALFHSSLCILTSAFSFILYILSIPVNFSLRFLFHLHDDEGEVVVRRRCRAPLLHVL
jgi:hypothetical protein